MFNILRVSGANATVEIRLDDLRVLHRLREAYTRGGFATQVLREVFVIDDAEGRRVAMKCSHRSLRAKAHDKVSDFERNYQW
jgi:hypothetical protein